MKRPLKKRLVPIEYVVQVSESSKFTDHFFSNFVQKQIFSIKNHRAIYCHQLSRNFPASPSIPLISLFCQYSIHDQCLAANRFARKSNSEAAINLWLISGNFSGERVLRSRQHDRGTSQERRYKRSHRRSPSSGRQHGHRDRDRDRLAHPTSSRRARIYRHHASSSTSQDRHRHRSPSSRSQVSRMAPTTDANVVIFCPMYL